MFRQAFRGVLWQLRLCAAQLHRTAATCQPCCFGDDPQSHTPGGLTCSEMLSEASSCTSRLDCAPAVRLPSCSVLLPGVPHSPPDLASGHSRRFGPACMTNLAFRSASQFCTRHLTLHVSCSSPEGLNLGSIAVSHRLHRKIRQQKRHLQVSQDNDALSLQCIMWTL